MRKNFILFVFVVLVLVLPGCNTKEAPPEVLEQYNQLKDNLDEENPGQAIEKIEEFVRDNPYPDIEKFAEKEKEKLVAILRQRYQNARDIARNGNFGEAETILKDLIEHAPGTNEGKQAENYLQFDFYYFQLQRTTMDNKFKEAREIAAQLRKHDLTPDQSNQLELMLDKLAVVDQAQQNNLKVHTMAVCRELQIMLLMYYQDMGMGRYPSSLSLDNLKEIGYGGGAIKSALSAIEDYRTSRGDFSFIAVSKDGSFRFRVTSDGVKEVHEK